MSESEVDERLKFLIEVVEGQRELAPDPDLPDPSPGCSICQGHRAEVAALPEGQVDAKLAELLLVLKESIGYGGINAIEQ
jgi:hypothetical protein